jgi:hypothetical protein
MRSSRQKLLMGALTATIVAIPFSAMAASGGKLTAELAPVPHSAAADGGSDVTGHADIKLTGRTISVHLTASGLTPGEPHAMHIHGVFDHVNECPTADADVNTGDPIDDSTPQLEGTPDGLISLNEGAPSYGPIDVSLTRTGATDPGSGLALERFVSADANGDLSYQRTITVSRQVAKNLSDLHIVIHGTDLPWDADSSSLSSLFEATLPVACGSIN